MESPEWTVERQTAVIRILNGRWTDEKDRIYDYIRKKFDIVELGGSQCVRRKSEKIMATSESHTSIAEKFMHPSTIKGKRKHTKRSRDVREYLTAHGQNGDSKLREVCREGEDKVQPRLLGRSYGAAE